ncbi:hypothetical protein NSERUTF1_7224 [Nocardia seriolae]|nr:hypothetical protein NSERUTF1_7224 [Nocardia seriolae]
MTAQVRTHPLGARLDAHPATLCLGHTSRRYSAVEKPVGERDSLHPQHPDRRGPDRRFLSPDQARYGG